MSRYRINSGEFRHRITIQKCNSNQNDYGEIDINSPVTWSDVVSVRAAIYPLSGKDFFSAETINNEITHKINIRYISSITSAMRIKFGERYFEIISPPINFQERNILLQIMCKEKCYET